jgi:hypothetical protein
MQRTAYINSDKAKNWNIYEWNTVRLYSVYAVNTVDKVGASC